MSLLVIMLVIAVIVSPLAKVIPANTLIGVGQIILFLTSVKSGLVILHWKSLATYLSNGSNPVYFAS